MAKIYYDEGNLNRLVNVGLESSINNLRKAIETSSMLYIPYEFRYRSYLKSLDDNLKTNLSSQSPACLAPSFTYCCSIFLSG